MKSSSVDLGRYLKVSYDKEPDILWLRIPGRAIQASSEVVAPLVIDFGSEEDWHDLVGVELHRASEFLEPMFDALRAERH